MSKLWPGFDQVQEVYQSKTARTLLARYGSPEEVAANESEARALMRRASRGKLSVGKIDATIESAKTTLAEPALAQERELLRRVVQKVDELSADMGAVPQQRDLAAARRRLPTLIYLDERALPPRHRLARWQPFWVPHRVW